MPENALDWQANCRWLIPPLDWQSKAVVPGRFLLVHSCCT